MKSVFYSSRTDLEVGDYVKIPSYDEDMVFQVWDIRLIHYFRSNKVEFEFQILYPPDKALFKTWFKRDDLVPINS